MLARISFTLNTFEANEMQKLPRLISFFSAGFKPACLFQKASTHIPKRYCKNYLC
jgi:hypothetical protein